MLRRPRARACVGGARPRRVRGSRSATRSPFLRNPSGRHAPPSLLAARVRPGIASLRCPGFASANSCLLAVAPPGLFTCSAAAAEVGPGGGGFLRARAGGRPRPSFNCWHKLVRGVPLSPGRPRACPEAGNVAAQAKLPPRRFNDELVSRARRGRGSRAGEAGRPRAMDCPRWLRAATPWWFGPRLLLQSFFSGFRLTVSVFPKSDLSGREVCRVKRPFSKCVLLCHLRSLLPVPHLRHSHVLSLALVCLCR